MTKIGQNEEKQPKPGPLKMSLFLKLENEAFLTLLDICLAFPIGKFLVHDEFYKKSSLSPKQAPPTREGPDPKLDQYLTKMPYISLFFTMESVKIDVFAFLGILKSKGVLRKIDPQDW